jgi:class I fructose-bisphosphate aldolase
MVKGSIEAGGSGASIGRNVFQHRNPSLMVKAMAKIIFDDGSVDEALKILK